MCLLQSRSMSTTLIEVRRAKPCDATAIAATHDEAWRGAYQGIIPGPELDKLINRRGPDWWDSAIRKGSRIAVLAFGDVVAGYANYGRNRARSLYYDGEIYELYLRPEFQGLGFGRKLFTAARRDLVQSGLQQPGDLGAVGQRAGGRLLPRARRQGGGPLVRAVRHPRARQGRLRLEQLTVAGRVELRTRHIAWVRGRPPAVRFPAPAVRRSCRPRAACWRAGRRWSSARRRRAPA